jgi:hypothetical protein
VRLAVLVLAVGSACSHNDAPARPTPAPPPRDAAAAVAVQPDPAPALVDAGDGGYPDLGAALTAILPADTRVIGFGELHNRTDRAQVTSTLAHFTNEALPVLKDRLSDLIIETWITDPHCGSAAQVATKTVTTTMKRPEATKSEIAVLADAAKAAHIQPHAMRITCDDYAKIAPPGKEMDVAAMLDLTTRELGRIASEAVNHRDKEPDHRPLIALYGGALHNDRFPDKGVEQWSYAAKVDDLTKNHYVEVDIIVPELAAGDTLMQKQPWYPLVEKAGRTVQVYTRGERSFVLILPRS